MDAGRCRVRSLAASLFVLALAAPALAQKNQLTELGSGPVVIPGLGNAELSGITWVGGARYLAVDDGRARLVPLEVTLAPRTDAIQAITVGESVPLEGARDAEGIAWLAKSGTVLVSDEGWKELREHDPKTGKLLRRIEVPRIFRERASKNGGLESIAAAPDGHLWIGNEDPLRLDGPGPTALEGAWLRLQRLGPSFAPAGQWAYRTEPGLGFVGLVDLLVTPRGELLTLERSLTGGGFTARIFEVDIARATDVTAFEKLRNRDDFWPARKTKLWERSGGFQNFEGLTLGPELASGGRLALIVSDGGGRRPPMLLALRLARVS